jgi:hypothetical protein
MSVFIQAVSETAEIIKAEVSPSAPLHELGQFFSEKHLCGRPNATTATDRNTGVLSVHREHRLALRARFPWGDVTCD